MSELLPEPDDQNPEAVRKLYESRKLKSISARWDARAQTWDEELHNPACEFNDDAAYARFIEAARSIVGGRSDFCTGQGVIDCGCGTGLVLASVISKFSWGIGVDISQKMIRAAESKAIPNSRFLVGDCFQLPGLCPRAGAIFSRGVLLSHYGAEQGKLLLCAMRAALVDQGFVVCDFLNQTAPPLQFHTPTNKSYYTGETAIQLALLAGFKSAHIIGTQDRRTLILVAESGQTND